MIMARAMTTRCCWPPESMWGYLGKKSATGKSLTSSIDFWMRCSRSALLLTPPTINGSSRIFLTAMKGASAP